MLPAFKKLATFLFRQYGYSVALSFQPGYDYIYYLFLPSDLPFGKGP